MAWLHELARMRFWLLACLLGVLLAGCAQEGVLPHLAPIPKETADLMDKKQMRPEQPVLIRIFKEESILEIWKAKDDGRFHHLKTYPICKWSGGLGPKLREGDRQTPEGFYLINRGHLNPKSKYHLSFSLGYPNRLDKANGRTGANLMVHGECTSRGCYAMTDALMEEIYAVTREAFAGGQKAIQVHAMPFRMTKRNMKRHRKSKWYGFWVSLKEGYDDFEASRLAPKVDVCARRYLVNARFASGSQRLDPGGPCPPHRKVRPEVYKAVPDAPLIQEARGAGGNTDKGERQLSYQSSGAYGYDNPLTVGGFALKNAMRIGR